MVTLQKTLPLIEFKLYINLQCMNVSDFIDIATVGADHI